MTAAAEPLLAVRDVSRTFGGFTALRGVTLDVVENEILGIAGPNGAGKSTLFNLISGVPFGPSSGSVVFGGRRIDGLAPPRIARLGLRRTFQAEQLFSTLSVRDNVAVAAAYLGTPRRLRTSEVTEALERVGIDAHAEKVSGESPLLVKKKLMIASALVARPRLLMLDEPAGGLNADDQRELVELIRMLRSTGLTVIVIEHVLGLLRAVADRLVVLAAGEILASGRPDEVLRDPAVVEAYLGTAG